MSLHELLTRSAIAPVAALIGAMLVAADPVVAQDPIELVRADPANRSGELEMSRAIVRMVAERSDSAAVRARGSTQVPWGRLAVGPEEVLAEIGAVAALGDPRAVPSVVQPPPLASPVPPAAATPARLAPTRAQPAAAQPAAEEKPKRYLGIFVKPEPTERGGGDGGGSSGGGGGGGGGGGW